MATKCWNDHKVTLNHLTVLFAREVNLLHCNNWGSRVHQTNEHTCLNLSIPLCSSWQSLESFWPTYLFSVDDGLEILGGEDFNSLSQGAGAEFIGNSTISGHSSNIHRIPHLKRGMNIYRDPTRTEWKHFFHGGTLQFCQPYARIGLASLHLEFSYLLRMAASRENEGGHHGCTTKIKRIRNFFFFCFI